MENPAPRSVIENLMRCPLCGAINAAINSECFCCSWQGEFDHEPERIKEGLADLLVSCPELNDVIDGPRPRRYGALAKMRTFFLRLFWPSV
jgi:hypothetical protein